MRSTTLAKVAVLRILLNGPSYGYSMMDRTGWPSGKIYGVLQGLVDEGWLERYNTDMNGGHGRPRVMYVILDSRFDEAKDLVDEARRLLY